MRVTFLAQGNNESLWLGSNSFQIGIHDFQSDAANLPLKRKLLSKPGKNSIAYHFEGKYSLIKIHEYILQT